MTDKILNQKSNCNCKSSCELPSEKKKYFKKSQLGMVAAMAICCITPLAIGMFAGGASIVSLLAWWA